MDDGQAGGFLGTLEPAGSGEAAIAGNATLVNASLVLGIGNTLLCDDGVGVHVVDALRAHPDLPAGIELVDGGTLSFVLAPAVAAAGHLVVVDAADLGLHAGAVRVFQGPDMDERLCRARRSSVHEVSLFDLMAVSRLAGNWPARRALVAVQPALVGWGEMPSAAVRDAIPDACRAVLRILRSWQH